jgi:SH3-like domain-containing protein
VAKKTTVRKSVLHKTPVIAAARGPAAHKAARTVAVAAAVTAAAAKPAPHPAAPAAPAKPVVVFNPNEGTVTHLPLPRFLSLRSDDVNMRSGPGNRYPIIWIYKRRELPVKVEREFDIWRAVEDSDGVKGWVQQNLLVGKRSFVITGTDPRTLREDPDASSDAVAVLKPGVVGLIRKCDAGSAWCQVTVGGYRGWLERDAFWGAAAGEVVAP